MGEQTNATGVRYKGLVPRYNLVHCQSQSNKASCHAISQSCGARGVGANKNDASEHSVHNNGLPGGLGDCVFAGSSTGDRVGNPVTPKSLKASSQQATQVLNRLQRRLEQRRNGKQASGGKSCVCGGGGG